MSTRFAAGESYVFLSYARADHERVLAVVRPLQAAGLRVWIDEAAIEGGEGWDEAIVRGIRDSAGVLLMCSPASLGSPNVLQEIRVAWTYHRPYLPVILEAAEIPVQARFYLEGRQWVDVLDRPQHVWLPRLLEALGQMGVQCGPPAVSPAPSPAAFISVSPHLPLQLTSFVGRGGEIARVAVLLAEHRLLTLTGEGGIGKTRLAQEVARATAAAYPDGVWLVELAALAEPGHVVRAVATALGVEAADRPVLDVVVRHVQARRALLILDNCEHLVVACAELVERLLRAAPALHILATSRERLAVGGEVTYRVRPLGVPAAARGRLTEPDALLAASDAVRLFVERAVMAEPSFRLTAGNAPAVAEICRRLDGIPFAIELAAARVRALSPEQIAARLADRFRLLTAGSRTALPRQKTLRALIDWSHDLLDDGERVVLRRLSVFVGGWTLEAAEAICAGGDAAGPGVPPEEILDLLTRLLDKSLIAPGGEAAGIGRFGFLETVRQYGIEKLAADGETLALQRRHRDWFLRLAEQAGAGLAGPEQTLWLVRLEADHDNLRAALAWSFDQGEGEAGMRCAAALWRFWQVRGYLSEGRRWLETAIDGAGGAPPALRAGALNAAGALAERQGEYEAARNLLGQALALYREHGDQRGAANALSDLGNVSLHQGDYEEAESSYSESLSLSRASGDQPGVARSLINVARIVQLAGRHAHAAALLEESLTISRQLQDLRAIAGTLNNLAYLRRLGGDNAQAARLLHESLALRRELGDKAGMASTLRNLGVIARDAGDVIAAEHHLRESLLLVQEIGNQGSIAGCLEVCAGLANDLGRAERAARLFGAAHALRLAADTPMPPSDRAEYDGVLARLRAALGEPAFARAWEEGAALGVDRAVAVALSEAAPA